MIEDRIGRRWQHMQVDYSIEERALGTGGAVALCPVYSTGIAGSLDAVEVRQ